MTILKVFGCTAFMNVPKEQKLKLGNKANPCAILLAMTGENLAIDKVI